MYKIYHNPRCKKSRAGLKYLESKGLTFEIEHYLQDGLSENILQEILDKSGLKPIDLVRKQEEKYRKELKNKEISDQEWLHIIVDNPKLLQRPIVIRGDKAVLADPPENIDSL